MSPLRISKRPVKHLNSELKNLAKAKKKSEEQLSSLKRDHGLGNSWARPKINGSKF
jgi:hypothetical protein